MTATLSTPSIEVDDDSAALHRLSIDNRWGDGVPIVAPTSARVQALVDATPYAPDHVLGALPPRYGIATVELVAVNAALAGVEPAAFPFVIAAIEAILVPEFNAFGLTTTTSSVFPMLIVNGPSRDALHIDYRAGCMGGAGGRGSMTIGRAVSLCLRNIGGQRAGETSRTVFGQPARFGLCFGEWEARSPWPSLAQRRGFEAGQDVVTVHGAKGTMPLADINNDDPRDLLYLIAKSAAYPLSNMYLVNTSGDAEVVIAVNPMWAERFGRVFPDIADLQQYLWDHAWQPIELWPEANRRILESKDRVDENGRVALVARPDQLVPIVCGGLGSLHAIVLPTFGGNRLQSVACLSVER